MLLEAELEGAIAILPEAVFELASPPTSGSTGAPPAAGSAASSTGPGPGSSTAGATIGELGAVLDLDYYVLAVHCLAGVVTVRPQDVHVPVPYGAKATGSKIDSGGVKKLVGASRVLMRRSKSLSGTERAMREQLVRKVSAEAAGGTSSPSIGADDGAAAADAHGAAASDLVTRLTQLAQTNGAQPSQLGAAVAAATAAHGGQVGNAAGAGAHSAHGLGMAGQHEQAGDAVGAGAWLGGRGASEWVDLLWRAHRIALVPSDAVLSRASFAIRRMREAVAAQQLEPSGSHDDAPPLVALRLLHDPASSAVAASATASLLGTTAGDTAGGTAPLPLTDDELEVDTSGEPTSPMRIVEVVREVATSPATTHTQQQADSLLRTKPMPALPVVFVAPAEMPAMPLVITAAWSRGLPAFSLPMLMQTSAPLLPWQHALSAAYREHASGGSSAGAAAYRSSTSTPGHERRLNRAVELTVQLAAERFFGGSLSASFHDVALLRCDVGRAATSVASPYSVLHAGSSAATLRRFFLSGALANAELWQHEGTGAPPAVAAAALPLPDSQSFSFTTGGRMRCPATAADLVPVASGSSQQQGQGQQQESLEVSAHEPSPHGGRRQRGDKGTSASLGAEHSAASPAHGKGTRSERGSTGGSKASGGAIASRAHRSKPKAGTSTSAK